MHKEREKSSPSAPVRTVIENRQVGTSAVDQEMFEGISTFNKVVRNIKSRVAGVSEQRRDAYLNLMDSVREGKGGRGVTVRGSSNREVTATEKNLGQWLMLAMEKAALEIKAQDEKRIGLSEKEGARYLSIDDKASRLEDRMKLAHGGDKSVTIPTYEDPQIFVDPFAYRNTKPFITVGKVLAGALTAAGCSSQQATGIVEILTTPEPPAITAPVPSDTPFQAESTSEVEEPTQQSTATPEILPEVCSIEGKQMAEMLLNNEVLVDDVEGRPLITDQKTREFLGNDEVVLSEIKLAISHVVKRLSGAGVTNISIPIFAGDINYDFNDTNINFSLQDAPEGNIQPVPEGYYSVEVKGFLNGGWILVVKGDNDRAKVVLPQGEKALSSWLMDPDPEGSVVIQDLPAQAAWGELRFVKVDGCDWTSVQVKDGQVVAVLDKSKNVDDIDNLWTLKLVIPTETAVPTETIEKSVHDTSALVEAMAQAGYGEVVLDPERDHNDQVEIIKENQQQYYQYFLNTLVLVNPEYFQKLGSQTGKIITSGEELVQFLQENNYLLPLVDGEGIRMIRTTYNIGYINVSYPLNNPVSLKNIGLMIIPEDEYKAVVKEYDAEDMLVKSGTAFGIPIDPLKMNISVAFGRHLVTEGDQEHFIVSVQIIKREDIPDNGSPGFPEGTPLDSEGVLELDRCARFTMLSLRALSTNPYPIEPFTYTYTDSAGNKHYNKSGGADKNGMIEIFTPNLFESFISGENLNDAPVEILKASTK